MDIPRNSTNLPLISVIIPTYNTSKYLSEAIESALSQSYRNTEIIVVDDGSTDNTQEVIQPYIEKITYLRKKNGGPASARNYGYKHSKGELIAFLDADDMWLPDKLEKQMKYFNEHPEIDMVHCNTWVNQPGHKLYPAISIYKPLEILTFNELFLNNRINILTVMIKSSVVKSLNGFDEATELIGIEDYELWLRVSQNHNIGYLNEILAIYRIHDNNISGTQVNIRGNLYILNKYQATQKFLFEKKKRQLFFEWGAQLCLNDAFSVARNKFQISFFGKGLKIVSLVGVFSCLLKTNFFLKCREESNKFKSNGRALLKSDNIEEALPYLFNSIKLNPLQIQVYKDIIFILLNK